MDKTVVAAITTGVFSIVVVVMKYVLDFFKARKEKKKKKNCLSCNDDVIFNDLKPEEKRKLLLKHHFFTRVSYWVNSKIPLLKIDTPLREKLIKKALTLKIKEGANLIREDVLDFSDNRHDKYKTSSEFIEKLVEVYESIWRANSIPDVFIEKYHYWHIERITEAYYQYERLWDSKFYDDFETRLAVLDMWTYLFNWTIIDAEKTLQDLNGDLSKELDKLKKQGVVERW